jgi:hypothetical protein
MTEFGRRCSCYPHRMAKSKKFDLENPAPVVGDEDEETLAAIDEGMRTLKPVEPCQGKNSVGSMG